MDGTDVGTEHFRVLAVVCNNDPRIGGLGEDLFAQLARTAALDAAQVLVDLVCAVNGHINMWVLVDIAQAELGLHDEFFGLESGRDEYPVFVNLGPLSEDPFHDVWYSRP